MRATALVVPNIIKAVLHVAGNFEIELPLTGDPEGIIGETVVSLRRI
jgi:hypothetical protein